MAVKEQSDYFPPPPVSMAEGTHLQPPGQFFSETPAQVLIDTCGLVLTYQQPRTTAAHR